MTDYLCRFKTTGWQPQAQLGDGFSHIRHPQSLRLWGCHPIKYQL